MAEQEAVCAPVTRTLVNRVEMEALILPHTSVLQFYCTCKEEEFLTFSRDFVVMSSLTFGGECQEMVAIFTFVWIHEKWEDLEVSFSRSKTVTGKGQKERYGSILRWIFSEI